MPGPVAAPWTACGSNPLDRGPFPRKRRTLAPSSVTSHPLTD
ncbi:hypothetical protein APASM_6244 [Actinosynnema pretiosum subsp. pretiosum]|nr:hypothetical protein APASM_6244 [Actinosynnema pretiosum subsp. pretiosum]